MFIGSPGYTPCASERNTERKHGLFTTKLRGGAFIYISTGAAFNDYSSCQWRWKSVQSCSSTFTCILLKVEAAPFVRNVLILGAFFTWSRPLSSAFQTFFSYALTSITSFSIKPETALPVSLPPSELPLFGIMTEEADVSGCCRGLN